MPKLIIFKEHVTGLEKYLMFGRDLYHDGYLLVFDNNWKVPKEFVDKVKRTILLD